MCELPNFVWTVEHSARAKFVQRFQASPSASLYEPICKTHQGPIVRKDKNGVFLAVQVAGPFHMDRMKQAWGPVLAQDFKTWRAAISHCTIPIVNVVYADDADNIFYAYNGTIPIRDASFQWTKPVDGSNPKTDWLGVHTFDELPQLLNPQCGYVQSCNSSPLTTTETKNPRREEFPAYMIENADVDMRTGGVRSSPHFFDQAELYSTQRLKPAWFSGDEVEQHAMSILKLQRVNTAAGSF